MTIASGFRTAALLLGLAAPLPAVAQDIAPPTPEGAQAIVTALRDWLAQHTAQMLDLSALDLKVMADGDTYRLELPFGGAYLDDDVVLSEAAVAATLKPLEGGRWEIVNAALPPRLEAQVRSRKDGGTSSTTITIESQETTGTLDPSLAGPSVFTTTMHGTTTEMRTEGAPAQASRIGKLTGRTEWTPSAPGRVTLKGDSVMEDYATMTALPGGEMATVTIKRIGGATRVENFDMTGFGALLRTAFELGAAEKARGDKAPGGKALGDKAGKGAADTAMTLRLLDQVAGMLDSVESEYTYDDVRVQGGPLFSGSLRHFGMGVAFGAPAGLAELKLRLALEGLESPMIPPGPWAEFVPHKVTLSPRIGGVPKEAVMALLRRAVETDGDAMAGEAMALLAAHPLTAAIENLLIELGPMRLTGQGSLEVSNPEDAAGGAELRATGLDALIRRVNAVKELKLAAPVLIFLKGIAVQEGNEAVWRITYSERKLVVNDTDMSDLMP
jgi:hypothetical protein